MDIVVSSNLERLLYHTSDAQTVSTLMESFAQHQMYQITDAHRARIRDAGFRGGYAKSSAARAYIRAVYEATGYLLDPHTAVAEVVRDTIPSEAASVVLSTASPFKFAKAMCEALEIGADSEQAALTSLSEQSGVGVPVQLAQLLTQPTKEPRFIDQTQLAPVIRKWLKNRTLSIRVPATTANIGPGFDALGIALNLYASFTLRFEGLYEGANEDRMIVAFGEGVPKAYQNQQNLLLQAFYRTAQAQGQVHYPKKLYLDIHSEIPVSRGLGSSAALIVAGVLCAYELTRAPYTKEQVLCAATAIEGHPDNVAPAVYGGFCASVMEGDQAYAMQLAIAPGLHFAAAVPNEELSTSEARGVLPEAVSHHDAADNVAHAAFLIGCLHNGRFDLLRTALRDHLHEPYRRALLPHYNELTELDARGMYISGAGSTVMLLDDRYTAQDYRKRLDAPWLTWYDLCICEQGATICDAYQPEAELELE